MADPEEDKQAEGLEAATEQSCPVEMYNRKRCGRPIHTTPPGVDKEPVCLMHSKDPNKSDAAFQEEFERILRDAGEGCADFTRFVFPSANYAEREFRAVCIFADATFMQNADFFLATFTQGAEFSLATFTRGANFAEATFMQDARFSSTEFMQDVSFMKATFTQEANFTGAMFTQNAYFSGATFTQDANFKIAAFTENAFFTGATFNQNAYFRRATFTTEACFENTVFKRMARFVGATFKERVEFLETEFRDDVEIQPGPMLNLVRFEKPELVLFYKTYLGHALLHNCDVSSFLFSSVRWRGRPGNGKRMVFEEVIDTKHKAAAALRTKDDNPNDRNYDLIAELYQQLKKNYDDKRDYWTAGDFHYGEMEMKRLATPQPNHLSRWFAEKIKKSLTNENPSILARWAKRKGYSERSFHFFRREWHRSVGLAALYKYASEYGESYGRPVLWLVGFLFLFMFLYPILGLRPTLKVGAAQAAAHEFLSSGAGTAELSYRNYIHYGSLQPGGEKLSFPALLGHSLMTSVGVAALQRDLAYEPSYPWGRALSWFELALTSTLIALFLLAVRRQFRR